MLDSLLALGPARLAALAALTAFLLVSTTSWLLGRRGERRGAERGREARALARRGARPAEIARRTRLSQDAVGLALRLDAEAGRGAAARQKSPVAAEAAVPSAPPESGAAPRGVVQGVLWQWVRVFAPLTSRRARALPLRHGVHPSDSSHHPAA